MRFHRLRIAVSAALLSLGCFSGARAQFNVSGSAGAASSASGAAGASVAGWSSVLGRGALSPYDPRLDLGREARVSFDVYTGLRLFKPALLKHPAIQEQAANALRSGYYGGLVRALVRQTVAEAGVLASPEGEAVADLLDDLNVAGGLLEGVLSPAERVEVQQAKSRLHDLHREYLRQIMDGTRDALGRMKEDRLQDSGTAGDSASRALGLSRNRDAALEESAPAPVPAPASGVPSLDDNERLTRFDLSLLLGGGLVMGLTGAVYGIGVPLLLGTVLLGAQVLAIATRQTAAPAVLGTLAAGAAAGTALAIGAWTWVSVPVVAAMLLGFAYNRRSAAAGLRAIGRSLAAVDAGIGVTAGLAALLYMFSGPATLLLVPIYALVSLALILELADGAALVEETAKDLTLGTLGAWLTLAYLVAEGATPLHGGALGALGLGLFAFTPVAPAIVWLMARRIKKAKGYI